MPISNHSLRSAEAMWRETPCEFAMRDAPTDFIPWPAWQTRWLRILGAFRILRTEAEVAADLKRLRRIDKPTVVAFANAHLLNLLVQERALFDAICDADHLFRDGSGVEVLLRLIGRDPGLNLNGTDLIPRILNEYCGQTVALLGTRHPHLQSARDHLVRLGHTIPDHLVSEGFEPVDHYVQLVKAHRPALVVLGMGMPKQELVAATIKAHIDFPCLLVCGGAIIDFLGGKVARAPNALRSAGLEWLFRWVLEPRRLFKRYLMGNPVFVGRSLRLALRLLD